MLDRWVLVTAFGCLTFLGFVALQYDDTDSFKLIVVAFVSLLPGASQLRKPSTP